jgi:hypothetical protein
MDSDIKNFSRQQKNRKAYFYVFGLFREPKAQADAQNNCLANFCNAT